MLQPIIEYKLVCPRKLELGSSPTSCCSIVVVHCASLLLTVQAGLAGVATEVALAATHRSGWARWCNGGGCRPRLLLTVQAGLAGVAAEVVSAALHRLRCASGSYKNRN